MSMLGGIMPKGGGGGGGGIASKIPKMGNAFGLVQGLTQIARGRRDRKRAEAATPETQGRQLLQQRTLLDRQRRALQTGTATRRQSEMFAQAFKTGATQSFRGGGGTRGLNQLTQMFNQGIIGLSNQSQQQQIALLDQRGAVADTLAAQERELGLLKQSKLEAKSEQMLKMGRSNATASLTNAMSGTDSPITPSPSSPSVASSPSASDAPSFLQVPKGGFQVPPAGNDAFASQSRGKFLDGLDFKLP